MCISDNAGPQTHRCFKFCVTDCIMFRHVNLFSLTACALLWSLPLEHDASTVLRAMVVCKRYLIECRLHCTTVCFVLHVALHVVFHAVALTLHACSASHVNTTALKARPHAPTPNSLPIIKRRNLPTSSICVPSADTMVHVLPTCLRLS